MIVTAAHHLEPVCRTWTRACLRAGVFAVGVSGLQRYRQIPGNDPATPARVAARLPRKQG
jgi:hypothetical protein